MRVVGDRTVGDESWNGRVRFLGGVKEFVERWIVFLKKGYRSLFTGK